MKIVTDLSYLLTSYENLILNMIDARKTAVFLASLVRQRSYRCYEHLMKMKNSLNIVHKVTYSNNNASKIDLAKNSHKTKYVAPT